jgi:hypothetical protein
MSHKSNKVITTYLNDHLAGAVAALALLDHLLSLQHGTGAELAELRVQIEEDQQVVQQLLQDLGGRESPVRKAAAWLTEKMGQVKLRLDDSGSGDLRMLEAFETLGLGIQGKLSLWRALAVVTDKLPQLASLNIAQLEARAAEQYRRVERMRLEVARRALSF